MLRRSDSEIGARHVRFLEADERIGEIHDSERSWKNLLEPISRLRVYKRRKGFAGKASLPSMVQYGIVFGAVLAAKVDIHEVTMIEIDREVIEVRE